MKLTAYGWPSFPADAQVDFQVQAMIGYFHRGYLPLSGDEFVGKTSEWSNTQTLTIEKTAPTQPPALTGLPSQSLEPTPTKPASQSDALFGFDWQIIAWIVTLVMITVIVLMILLRKKIKPNFESF